MTEAPRDPQTLDLIAQLLSRSRRWELLGAGMIVAAVFSAGGGVMAFRNQFAQLTENQVAIKRALDQRIEQGDSYVTDTAKVDGRQDAAIASLTAVGTRNAEVMAGLLQRQRENEAADTQRDKLLTETATTQTAVVRLLDRMLGSQLDIGPHLQPNVEK